MGHTSLVALPAYFHEQLAKERYCVPSARIMTVPAGQGVVGGVCVIVGVGVKVGVIDGICVKVGMGGRAVAVEVVVVVAVDCVVAVIVGGAQAAVSIKVTITSFFIARFPIFQQRCWRCRRSRLFG